MIHPNFCYLQKQWFTGMPAKRAFSHYRAWNEQKLSFVLRHHTASPGEISDKETWLRDDYDYLLGFYSIIEIAAMIGFFDAIPEAFKKKHLPFLMNAYVRRYYEWHYPVDLPRRLRERMQFGVAYTVEANAELHAAFLEFLELMKILERDEDIESFLWVMDGGAREDKSGVCDLSAVKKGLKKPARFAKAVQLPSKKRTELDRALNGFSKFIEFCEDLSALIDRLHNTPEVAESLWLANIYWFRQLDRKLGANLSLAIASFSKWQVSAPDKAALTRRVHEMERVISRLSLPPCSTRRAPKIGSRIKRMMAIPGIKDCQDFSGVARVVHQGPEINASDIPLDNCGTQKACKSERIKTKDLCMPRQGKPQNEQVVASIIQRSSPAGSGLVVRQDLQAQIVRRDRRVNIKKVQAVLKQRG